MVDAAIMMLLQRKGNLGKRIRACNPAAASA
jgi:hypothetical protein